MMTVRTLRSGEPMPAGIQTGFEGAAMTPEFVWLAEDSDGVAAVLVASGAHQMIFLHRIVAVHAAPPMTILYLLRGAARDCLSRGYIGFILGPLDVKRKPELKLLKIAVRCGGLVRSSGMVGGAIRFFLDRLREAA